MTNPENRQPYACPADIDWGKVHTLPDGRQFIQWKADQVTFIPAIMQELKSLCARVAELENKP